MKCKSKTAWYFLGLAGCSALLLGAAERPAQEARSKSGAAKPHPQHAPAASQQKKITSGSVRLSELLEARFTGAGGKELGAVADLLIDTQKGNIDFAILVRPVADPDPGVRLIPVPWGAINVEPERAFTLNVDRQKMEATPGMEDSTSELDQAGSGVTIFRFFGIEPPAEGGADSPGGELRGHGRGGPGVSPPSMPRVPQMPKNKGLDI